MKDRCQTSLTIDGDILGLIVDEDGYVTFYCDRKEGHRKLHRDSELGFEWESRDAVYEMEK